MNARFVHTVQKVTESDVLCTARYKKALYKLSLVKLTYLMKYVNHRQS